MLHTEDIPSALIPCARAKEELLYRIVYDGYLQREVKAAQRLHTANNMVIPDDFSFKSLPSLRNECIEKLTEIKPNTLGQASRISGVNPADISILHIYLERYNKEKPNASRN